MYNRYIRNDQGSYTRVQEEEHTPHPSPPPTWESEQQKAAEPFTVPPLHQESTQQQEPPKHEEPQDARSGFISGTLRKLLDQLHLDSVDTGDLLLLLILFFLFEEGADEEVLIALGLMLIL